MHYNVIHICTVAYLELRRIIFLRKYLSVIATKTLMFSFVIKDYCNLILFGSSQYLIEKFQKIQATADRVIFRVPRLEPTSELLCTLHWLYIWSRNKHNICHLCYVSQSYVNDSSPTYLFGLNMFAYQQDTPLFWQSYT